MNKKIMPILKKKLFLIREIIGLIILLIARFFYIKSLKGCNGDEFSCLGNIQYIIDDINYCLISSFFFLLFLLIIQLKICNIFQIKIFIAILLELSIKDIGNDFNNHGILNLSALLLILFVGEIILIIIFIYIYLIKNVKLRFIYILTYILVIILYFINIKNKYYCLNWDVGINGTKIDNENSIYPCKINIPKKNCLIDIIGPFMDFSIFIDCKKRKEKEKYYLLSISNLKNKSELVKKIGFPITIGKEEEISSALYGKDLFNYVMNHLIDMDDNITINKLEEREKPEVILDYTKNLYGEIKIKINYNELLSKKRLSLEKDKEKNNIIFLYMDNLSRVHFYRQYQKTKSFLQQFFKYEGFNPKIEGQNFHAFEFLKYHKFDQATLNNAIPMFSGEYFNGNNSIISIVKDFKEYGYMTCNVQDICHKELMRIGPLNGYRYIEFDHEYSSPKCDPNIYNIGYGIFKGENGILRKCLYGKENFEYNIEYAKQFWEKYKDNKRFLRIVNTYAHEYSGEKSKYADDILFNFLKDLYFNGQMENTSVFIVGDHGYVGLFGLYKVLHSNDWNIELALPIFIIITFDKKNTTYYNQYTEMIKNQQNLITPFDIFYTLRNIAFREKYKNNTLFQDRIEGESLFKYINPFKRACNNYHQMNKGTCQCKLN